MGPAAFSPAGRQLAVPLQPRRADERAARRLALIDVARRTVRVVPGSRVPAGYTFVAWSASGRHVFITGGERFTARLPAGWELDSQSLTPRLSNPVEILSAGTVRDARPQEGSCAQLPVGALERMGPRDVFVTVQERYGEPRFPDRPAHFALTGKVEHGDGATCAPNETQLDEYWFGFRDAGRGFHVLVALGRDAPPQRREEALALLDSLRFEPEPQGVHLDPDMAMAFEDRAAGLAWRGSLDHPVEHPVPIIGEHVTELALRQVDRDQHADAVQRARRAPAARAAHAGTRSRPFTDVLPSPPVPGRPLPR